MKKILIPLIIVPSFIASQIATASIPHISLEDAAKKTFSGNICSKKFQRYLLTPNIAKSGSLSGGEDSKAAADKLAAEAKEECDANEKKMHEAMDSMQKSWDAACRNPKYNCIPFAHRHAQDNRDPSNGTTNCGNGEIKLSNANNDSMFCVYTVKNGATDPKLAEREDERCYVGDDDNSGYGEATVYIPQRRHKNARFYIHLTCSPPGKTVHISDFDVYEDPIPKEEPPKEEEPKKDK